jgi:hypothetical protein
VLRKGNSGQCLRCRREEVEELYAAASRWQHNTKRGRRRRQEALEALTAYESRSIAARIAEGDEVGLVPFGVVDDLDDDWEV